MPAFTPSTTAPTVPFDDTAMREALSRFCTGVAVITARRPDGSPVGMAVQSFSSVSLDPPLVCFCPALTSTTWPAISEAGRFAVNVLAADQQELCRQFAVTGGDKFHGVDWRSGVNGAPLLTAALATLECELVDALPGGDHLIALGRVTALTPPERLRETGPLLYFRRTYGRLRPASPASPAPSAAAISSRSASIASARSRSEA
ncbi:monooxygenase [Streptomyces sp. NRRL F-4489]|uniref:flavin reductase family protein n=1 Tax=Streptomyces sp. NRRL F-4489 TaxID=1609095 RepID=UPI00074A9FFC|nr:flavin reductase family protein [Streptomyces sp. NRRL F-4489]KUL35010.1 monooxygenase [Streptomyces sp. NRRL F-4489]